MIRLADLTRVGSAPSESTRRAARILPSYYAIGRAVNPHARVPRVPILLHEPRSVAIVNIGPTFRGHYETFSPKSGFPPLIYHLRSSAMKEGSLSAKEQALNDQKEIDALAEGLQVGYLKHLVGNEAANYTGGIEEMYERMLVKVESFASEVEKSSAKVFEQGNRNRKLRYRIARIGR